MAIVWLFLMLAFITAQVLYHNRDKEAEEQHEQDVFNACLGKDQNND